MNNDYFETVEFCAYCETENIYPMWDVDVRGFVVICNHCGKEIMLCDECMHRDDNEDMRCDWCETDCGGKCFRGITRD